MSTTAAKKFRSKWFRIAVEGATTDGRNLERAWITEMAAQYSPNTYGARINCEHIRGLGPDSTFGAYGDVLSCKAEEVDISGKKKLALFAQIEPTATLIDLNKRGQKIYTSIEVNPKFADTGKAYLVGLAVTDSPASLGTEALQFSAQHGTLAGRKQDKENLFSEAIEARFEFEEVSDQPGMFAALKQSLADLLGQGKDKESKDATKFADLGEAMQQLVTFSADQATAVKQQADSVTKLTTQVDQLTKDLTALQEQLSTTPDKQHTQRPPVTGGNQQVLTDC
ncbi:GPO family capsid scaffolding protein [Pseudomonas sp. MSSRFD41]|uniref:GPO family capsid scaffolding protein n=1 Tax=Pseudomonas sp. MSSRFD41 TaxID=1310370 RepID=UPI00163AF0B0|nr:GPO family capsid scaffolding protein [Pseudomonas sp. MSSRFD41]MBC2659709.1 GPO family capsid scaffolding protein [Pseudomonas sp. MSSRFD41]